MDLFDGGSYYAIYLNHTENGSVISNNYIGGSAANCGGAALIKNNTSSCIFYGIYVNVGTTGATEVQGNTIQNIDWRNSAANHFYAIYANAGLVNVGTNTGNTIGNATGTGFIILTNATSSSNLFGIYVANATATVKNNTIGAMTANNSNSANSTHFTGIYKSNGNYAFTCENNIIGSTTTANSCYATSASTSINQNVVAIDVRGPNTNIVSNNTVANITNGTTNPTVGTLGYTRGIYTFDGNNTIANNTVTKLKSSNLLNSSTSTMSVGGIVVAAPAGTTTQNFYSNTVSDLSNDNAGFAGYVIGIYIDPTNTNFNVYNNFVYNLSTTAASGNIIGIKLRRKNATFYNNIVSIGDNTAATIYGLWESGAAGENSKWYNNTVYIKGTVASGTEKSYCLYSDVTTNTRDFRNNIFYNARSTTGGSNLHYAAYYQYTTNGNLTNDYNDYYVTGTGGTLGFYNSTNQTTSTIVTGLDVNSLNIDPQFINAGSTIVSDYRIQNTLANGITIGTVTTDFYGTIRPATPNLGALEDFNLTVNATIGDLTEDYPNLKTVFDAINAGTHRGVIDILINGNVTESTSAILNASGSGSSSYTSITIYPTGLGYSISGSFDSPLIYFDGADNVTIDGRVNLLGTTPDLTIVNSNATTTPSNSTIRFKNDASQNTIRYCYLKGSSLAVNGGIIYLSSTTGTTGNDNNTIEYNNITATDNTNRPLYSIYSQGTTGKDNDNNIIRNNKFYDSFCKVLSSIDPAVIFFAINNSYNSVINNSFYETTTFDIATGASYYAIAATNTGDGFVINNNYIGGTAPNCGGSPMTKNNSRSNYFFGIGLGVGTGTATEIQGNVIQNIDWQNNGNDGFDAIFVNSGKYNIGTITGNTIGSATGNNSIKLTTTTTGGAFWGIETGTTTFADVRNNTIGSVTVANTNNAYATDFYGIYVNGNTTDFTCINNTIGSTTTANSINATSLSTAEHQIVNGIDCSSTGTNIISNNTIQNLTSNTTSTSMGICRGIYIYDGSNTITNNTIKYISNANANDDLIDVMSVCGILFNFPVGATQTVTGNTISNLSNTNPAFNGMVAGIFTNLKFNNHTFSNNFIHSLSVNSSAANIAGIKIFWSGANYYNNVILLGDNSRATIYGIYEVGGVSNIDNIYFNTIYINGSVGAGTEKSYCLYSNSSNPTRDFRNNIFFNARSTTGGSNLHYAAYYNYAVNTNLTNDYNDYYVTGTGGVLGYYNATNITTLPIITGLDANSKNLNPQFVNAGSTIATDYVPATILSGITISGQTIDYAATTRDNPPTIGAFESSATSTIWIGPEPAHWTNGAPTASINAVIDWLYNETIDINCKNLTINSGKVLEIQSGYYVKVNGTLTNNAGASGIFVKVGGSLLHTTPNVQGSVEMYLTGGGTYGTDKQWHIVGSPVATHSAGLLSGSVLYTYIEGGTSDYTAWNTFSGIFQPTTGYLVYNNTATTKTFTGDLNVGTLQSYTLVYANDFSGGAYKGFNLVSNPYTASIDWITLWNFGTNQTQLDRTVWIWNPDPANYGYATYDGVAFTNSKNGSRYIAPCQGFFVRATTTNCNVKFDNSFKTTTAGTFMKKSAVPDLLKLKISDNTHSDETALYFTTETSGSTKLYSMSAAVPQIYIKEAANEYAIARFASPVANKDVSLNVYCGVSGKFTLSVSDFTFGDNVTVTLEDLKLKTITNITKTSTYQFDYVVNESANRFIIHIKSTGGATAIQTANEEGVKIYSSGKFVYVENQRNTVGKVNVFDVLGKLIYSEQINGNQSSIDLSSQATGIFVIQYSEKGFVKTQKVMIQ